jgi:hypothetical protein
MGWGSRLLDTLQVNDVKGELEARHLWGNIHRIGTLFLYPPMRSALRQTHVMLPNINGRHPVVKTKASFQ